MIWNWKKITHYRAADRFKLVVSKNMQSDTHTQIYMHKGLLIMYAREIIGFDELIQGQDNLFNSEGQPT